ncbi:MAG: hypothetical protein HYZ24_08090 [Chloroflexi bacterium]|nr:hypothetical protein [Chloroflexota bacterium]
MKNKYHIVYSINIEDIQNVANQEINRELSDDEVKRVEELIGKKIDWYEVILDSINEVIIFKER